jgi:hypothetical protein
MDSAFGFPLMSEWVTKEGDDAIAQALVHIALIASDAHGTGILVTADDPVQDFRIDPIG